MKIPDIDIRKCKGIRYYSSANPWLDFVVIVGEDWAEDVATAVKMAMDCYWDSDDLCYGDLVNEFVSKIGIPYMIIFHDSTEESPEYEAEWEELLIKLKEGGLE